MIIDEILSRKNGWGYDAKKFYEYCNWSGGDDGERGWPIARAMDEGEERDVRGQLIAFIITNGYCGNEPKINRWGEDMINYINSVNWLEDEPMSERIQNYLSQLIEA